MRTSCLCPGAREQRPPGESLLSAAYLLVPTHFNSLDVSAHTEPSMSSRCWAPAGCSPTRCSRPPQRDVCRVLTGTPSCQASKSSCPRHRAAPPEERCPHHAHHLMLGRITHQKHGTKNPDGGRAIETGDFP
ncbi:hypothetical protein EYF80_063927 [Liparis tanakae]|uniref:Uncharacterized protein n=1 Tax=Liparis tanakae TaxID=230148 RepID=A0A4Z2EAN3_9TELE|nr:hypothetical protein EYF80_063927 [Liparis tanakae]